MKMKRYEVTDMKEALRMIKEDLGPDAVILSTKKVMKHKNFGLLARPILEVTAAVDYKDPKPESIVTTKQYPPLKRSIDISVTDDDEVDYTTNQRSPKNQEKTDEQILQDLAYHTITDPDIAKIKPVNDYYQQKIPSPTYRSSRRVQADDMIELRPIDEVRRNKDILTAEATSNNPLSTDKMSVLMQDISDIKRQLTDMKYSKPQLPTVDVNSRLKDAYQSLCKNGVDEVISYRFLKNIEKQMADNLSNIQIKTMLIDALSDMISIESNYYEALQGRFLALVGPTGVGKTTTLAKIAANLKLIHKKSVALITIDNFRIGAIEQLKTYAEIINTPLYSASSPNELKGLIRDLRKEYDFILIDSMGRSQFDTKEIESIRSFLQIDQDISVSLVLSLASNQVEMIDTLDRYAVLNPNYLIFTKLDETRYFGSLINIPIKKRVPLLLVTMGQNVPDDMEVPDGKKIAKKVLQDIPSLWGDRKASDNI